MCRVIKFRAWQEDGMIYFNPVSLMHSYEKRYKLETYDTSENGGLLHDDFIDKEYNEPTLMQFTGLIDRNGIEIYEGDIIQTEGTFKNHLNEVYFDEEWSSFFAKPISQDWYVTLKADSMRIGEVIGNIYENSDLLATT